MKLSLRFPVEYQMDSHDCGPACLKIIAKYYGRYFSLQYLRDQCGITKEGVSLLDISTGAENIGLRTMAFKCNIDTLREKAPLPSILFWNNNHFIVVYHVGKKHVWVSDPQKGRVKYTYEEFRKGWYQEGQEGVLLAVSPSVEFNDTAKDAQRKDSLSGMVRYFYPFKNNFGLIGVIMLLVTLLEGVLPFISKAVIDVGIKTSDVKFIYMVLIGNIAILVSIMVFNVIRDWILMHITARVNIALISDYLIKLMKLLIRLYAPSFGDITMGTMNVKAINLHMWRDMCGVVLQDGKIFSDTILNNIVLEDENINYDKLHEACSIAQIEDEILAMPKGYHTLIGEKGRGLSGGQRQRILIARALYRNPTYLFLDEATNALDTINERKIVEAMNGAFQNRTVVVIAHRLSTIRKADQIVVMDKGMIVEVGNHKTLMERQGAYYVLVSSQSEVLAE